MQIGIIRIYNSAVIYFLRGLSMNTFLILGASKALVIGSTAWVCRK